MRHAIRRNAVITFLRVFVQYRADESQCFSSFRTASADDTSENRASLEGEEDEIYFHSDGVRVSRSSLVIQRTPLSLVIEIEREINRDYTRGRWYHAYPRTKTLLVSSNLTIITRLTSPAVSESSLLSECENITRNIRLKNIFISFRRLSSVPLSVIAAASSRAL